MLHGERFPEAMDGAFSDVAHDLGDVAGAHALFRELDGAIDERLRHRSARVWLERNLLHHPRVTEIAPQWREVRCHRRRERAIEPVLPLEHGARANEAASSQQGRAET